MFTGVEMVDPLAAVRAAAVEETRCAGRKLPAIVAFVEGEIAAAAADDLTDEEAVESAEAQIGLVLGVAAPTASRWVALARDLAGRLPLVLDAVEAGTVTLPTARVILEEPAQLSIDQVARLQDVLLAKAEGRTPSALRPIARRAVARIDADAVRRRREQALRAGGVRLSPGQDGLLGLSALLAAEEAIAVLGVIDTLAREAVPGEARQLDERRAEVLVDLVLHPGRESRVKYVVHFDPSESANDTVDLRGHGPLPSSVLEGLDAHPDRYTPGARLTTAVRERHHHCRFPVSAAGSSVRSGPRRQIPPGGRTVLLNLVALCRHHHRVKHLRGRDLHLDPDGTATWTTPHGRTYRTEPPWPGRESGGTAI